MGFLDNTGLTDVWSKTKAKITESETNANSYTNTAISNIKIGGRNLIKDSSFEDRYSGAWNTYGFCVQEGRNGGNCIKMTASSLNVTNYMRHNPDIDLAYYIKPGDKFTISAWVKQSGIVKGTTNPLSAIYTSFQNDGAYVASRQLDIDATLLPDEWTCVSKTFTAPTTSTPYTSFSVHLYFRDCTGTIWIDDLKLELGSYATTWTPALEDNACLDALDIGGRNLLLNSNLGWSTVDHKVLTGSLSEQWIPGEVYTISLKGTIVGTGFAVYRDNIGNKVVSSKMNYDEDKDLFWTTFTCPSPGTFDSTYNSIAIYNDPYLKTNSATIDWVKIEKGNVVTDWSPAPEDLVEEAVTESNAYTVESLDNMKNGNLLIDSSFEYSIYNVWDSYQYRVREGRYGGYCIKITHEEFGKQIYIGKKNGVNPARLMEPGGTYTLSAWVKCIDMVVGTTDPFAAIYFQLLSGSTAIRTIRTILVTDETIAINGESWTRVSTTFTLASSAFDSSTFTIYYRDHTGTIMIDDIQLEKNDHATEWAPSVWDEKLDSILQVGGRNLALNSNVGWVTTEYRVISGRLCEQWVPGETYTVSLKGRMISGTGFLFSRDSGGMKTIKTLTYDQVRDVYNYTFTCPQPHASDTSYNTFSVHNYPQTTDMSCEIDWIKVERGTMATDWTPALEDTQRVINSTLVSANTYTDELVGNSTVRNLIPDSSFELDGSGAWSTYSYCVNEGIDGGNCLKLTHTELSKDIIVTSNPLIDYTDFIKPGEMYTWSAWVKGIDIVAGTTSPTNYITVMYYKNGTQVSSNTMNFLTSEVIADNGASWTRLTHTFAAQSVGSEYYDEIVLRIRFRDYTGTLMIDNMQLEKGSVAHDWVPAIEDASANSMVYTNKLEGDGENLVLDSTNCNAGWSTTTYLACSGTISEDFVQGNPYTISLKGTLENTGEGSCFKAVRGVNSQRALSDLVYDVDRDIWYATVTSCPAPPAATPDDTNSFSILNYPNDTKVSANIEWVKIERGTNVTRWSPAPEDAKKYVDDSIANLDILNTNLIQDSSFEYPERNLWNDVNGWGGIYVVDGGVDGGKCMEIVGAASTTKRSVYTKNLKEKLKDGRTYTFSIWLKSKDYVAGTGTTGSYVSLVWANESGTTVKNLLLANNQLSNIGDTWTRFQSSFVNTGIEFSNLSVWIVLTNATGSMFIDNIKLEEGDVATDWTPSPEDYVVVGNDGRNFILDSSFEYPKLGKWRLTDAVNNSVMSIVNEGRTGGRCLRVDANTDILRYTSYVNVAPYIEPGKQYTLSGWVKMSNLVQTGEKPLLGLLISFSTSSGTWVANELASVLPCAEDKWIRIYRAFTATTSDYGIVNVICYVRGVTGTAWFDDIKLEAGSEPTPWSPAPEDTDANKLYISGENLMLDSNQGWTSTGLVVVNRAFLVEQWVPGETYTVSLKGTIDGTGFRLNRDDRGTVIVSKMLYDIDRDIYCYTFKCPDRVSSDTYGNVLSIYNYPESAAKSATIEWIKVEKGNCATGYSQNTYESITMLPNINKNIMPDSSFEYGFSNYWTHSGSSISNEGRDGGSCLKFTSTALKTTNYCAMYNNESALFEYIEPGIAYTLSAWVKFTDYVAGTTNTFVALHMLFMKNGSGVVAKNLNFNTSEAISAGDWIRLSTTLIFATDSEIGNYDGIRPYIYFRDCTGTLLIDDIQFERGTLTDYQPSSIDRELSLKSYTKENYIENVSVTGSTITFTKGDGTTTIDVEVPAADVEFATTEDILAIFSS